VWQIHNNEHGTASTQLAVNGDITGRLKTMEIAQQDGDSATETAHLHIERVECDSGQQSDSGHHQCDSGQLSDSGHHQCDSGQQCHSGGGGGVEGQVGCGVIEGPDESETAIHVSDAVSTAGDEDEDTEAEKDEMSAVCDDMSLMTLEMSADSGTVVEHVAADAEKHVHSPLSSSATYSNERECPADVTLTSLCCSDGRHGNSDCDSDDDDDYSQLAARSMYYLQTLHFSVHNSSYT